eukprot:1348739-Rhodomonas_salina.3
MRRTYVYQGFSCNYVGGCLGGGPIPHPAFPPIWGRNCHRRIESLVAAYATSVRHMARRVLHPETADPPRPLPASTAGHTADPRNQGKDYCDPGTDGTAAI